MILKTTTINILFFFSRKRDTQAGFVGETHMQETYDDCRWLYM
jgi:hypothetical protein